MKDDLLDILLTYECPFTGAKRVAGLGAVKQEHGKCHGCSCWRHTCQITNYQLSIDAAFLSMELRKLKPTCELAGLLPPSTPAPVLSLRLHIEADDPLNAAKNPFFD